MSHSNTSHFFVSLGLLAIAATLCGGAPVEEASDLVIPGEPDSRLGTGVGFLPDLDGDGRPELVAGAPGANELRIFSGEALFGTIEAPPELWDFGESLAVRGSVLFVAARRDDGPVLVRTTLAGDHEVASIPEGAAFALSADSIWLAEPGSGVARTTWADLLQGDSSTLFLAPDGVTGFGKSVAFDPLDGSVWVGSDGWVHGFDPEAPQEPWVEFDGGTVLGTIDDGLVLVGEPEIARVRAVEPFSREVAPLTRTPGQYGRWSLGRASRS